MLVRGDIVQPTAVSQADVSAPACHPPPPLLRSVERAERNHRRPAGPPTPVLLRPPAPSHPQAQALLRMLHQFYTDPQKHSFVWAFNHNQARRHRPGSVGSRIAGGRGAEAARRSGPPLPCHPSQRAANACSP